jgi:hypothetical protein
MKKIQMIMRNNNLFTILVLFTSNSDAVHSIRLRFGRATGIKISTSTIARLKFYYYLNYIEILFLLLYFIMLIFLSLCEYYE